MAFASRLPVQAPASHKQFGGCARSVSPSLRQQRSNRSLHTHVSRRHSLLSGSTIFGSALLQSQSTVAQAATAVYHQVNVSLPSIDEADSPERPEDPPTYVTASGRIVAIGDLHGDMGKTIRSLQIARLAEQRNGQIVWTGGDTVVVQLGDVLDRGDTEIGILRLLRQLDQQARLEGGAVYMLNGNHESLNVCGDFR
eukprot:GHUV01003262.1.p1 GENE.GHUV01003262.1~~GHUV01003262.1.p1  ORF type:complete len:197 (+),score=20.82 GHUV01003262.1:162-752(+)